MIDKHDEGEMGKRKLHKQRRLQRHQRRKKNKVKATQTAPSQALPLPQIEIWTNTHRKLVEWHHQQMLRLCGIDEIETDQVEKRSSHCLDYVWESSSEDEDTKDEEEESVDENYLKFLEMTIQHQEELKQRRERDQIVATASANATTPTPTATLNEAT